MFGFHFFTSVIPRLDQMLGNLFYRGVQPHRLNEMFFSELKYWNEWHKVIEKKEAELIPKAPKTKGKK